MQPPLFPGRNPDSGTDPILDLMLADALPQDEPKGPADTTRPAREFAREHGWPVPQPEPRKWVRCLAVVIGSVLLTLLIGQGLEKLRVAGQKTNASPVPAPIQTPPQPTPTSQPTPAPQPRPVFQPDPPEPN
jgi:hypothetical protein